MNRLRGKKRLSFSFGMFYFSWVLGKYQLQQRLAINVKSNRCETHPSECSWPSEGPLNASTLTRLQWSGVKDLAWKQDFLGSPYTLLSNCMLYYHHSFPNREDGKYICLRYLERVPEEKGQVRKKKKELARGMCGWVAYCRLSWALLQSYSSWWLLEYLHFKDQLKLRIYQTGMKYM